jgi:hypothetical protein
MDGLHFIIPPACRGNPWFEDGNIILLVEDDDHNPLKAFKVHRGVLARQSEVFGAMFDIPQPTSAMDSIEHVDGSPVIRMYDLPNELSNLIKGLYDGVCVNSFLWSGRPYYRLSHIGTGLSVNEMWKIFITLLESYDFLPSILLPIYASRPFDI